jgi:hypothetical protein
MRKGAIMVALSFMFFTGRDLGKCGKIRIETDKQKGG